MPETKTTHTTAAVKKPFRRRAPLPAAAPVSPDAELIATCDAYIRAWQAYNVGAHLPARKLTAAETDELDEMAYERVSALERHAKTLTARTIEGVTAEAKVAKCVGWNPTGISNFDGGHGSEWTERVMWSLLRVHGEAV